MTIAGQIEKRTQARVVALFRERLCYDYLGDGTDQGNLELTLLRGWLAKQDMNDITTSVSCCCWTIKLCSPI